MQQEIPYSMYWEVPVSEDITFATIILRYPNN